MKAQIINDSLITENFSEAYPILNKYMVENADFQKSRNGDTKEILDFKTKLLNPYKRCVGNNGRNINIFFLMAEAMWIFVGKKDLKTLELFNAQMKEYSDDGESFHAPYGFRIRHQGVSSFDKNNVLKTEENTHGLSPYLLGRDQLYDALMELDANHETRQVVLQIWDANLDLGTKTKDKPCNDLVLFKIREGKLITTIANRSNDLHWGLPTNIYQFSFLSEMMSLILGIKLGTQTHNSQSLHFYLNNEIAGNMYENLQFNPTYEDLYDLSNARPIQVAFPEGSGFSEKLKTIDTVLELILDSFLFESPLSTRNRELVGSISKEFLFYHDLCHIYLRYKNGKKDDMVRATYANDIYELAHQNDEIIDVAVLAQNFFVSRIKDKEILSNLKSDGTLFSNKLL